MENESAKILALLPAYNEEKHLEKVLTEVKRYIEHVLVVDDGSADRTAEIARGCGVHVLSRGYNCGKGQSLKDGYTWALENGYDAVIMLDSDGQHDPACIPDFIRKFEETKAPLIIGARDYAKMPMRRRIPNKLGKALLSACVGQEIKDNQSGYRLLNRGMMQRMLSSEQSGYHFEVEMIAAAIAEGWKIEWVSIPTIYGDEKSKIKPLEQFFGFIGMCFQCRKMIREKRAEKCSAAN